MLQIMPTVTNQWEMTVDIEEMASVNTYRQKIRSSLVSSGKKMKVINYPTAGLLRIIHKLTF